jgi:branched-chain amino acid transport system permease protein
MITAAPIVIRLPSVLRIGSIFFLTVTALAGLHVLTGLARFMSLAQAGLAGVGAYATALLTVRAEMPVLLALCAGAAISAAVALLLSIITYRLADHYFALATLAAGQVLSNVFRGATPITGGANGFPGIPPLMVFGIPLDTPIRYYPACACVGALALAFVYRFERATIGRSLRAFGDEGVVVEALGVSAIRLRMLAFVVSGTLAGLAGAMSAHIDGFVGPENFGIDLSILYICFLVIGGLGRISGIVLGAALASIGPELFRSFYAWQMVIVALASLALLVSRSVRRTSNAPQQPVGHAPEAGVVLG